MSAVTSAVAPIDKISMRRPRRTSAPRRWERRYAVLVALGDGCVLTGAGLLAYWLRRVELSPGIGGVQPTPLRGISYIVVALLIGPAWVLLGFLSRGYAAGVLARGAREWNHLANTALRFFAILAVTSYVFRANISRAFVAIALPLGLALVLCVRVLARAVLLRYRAKGRCMSRVIALGTADEVDSLITRLRREPSAGLGVIAACMPPEDAELALDAVLTPLGRLGRWASRVGELKADTVAVAGTSRLPRSQLRRLAWELEGVGVDLVLVPEFSEMATSRVHVRPAGTLTLLQVKEPRFDGGTRLLKGALDRVLSVLLIVLALPVLAVAAAAIKATSDGPVVFRQTRIGRDGQPFTVLKLRTMQVRAEQLLPALRPATATDGPLFKLRDDPRITPVGRVLRRWSIDELPQLFNVLRGDMSLVGPRPGLPEEVREYGADVGRRLLVRPGITGLWQVSGRSDLSWAETVRLDLAYVENWSVALDLSILAKTLRAVLRGRGAY